MASRLRQAWPLSHYGTMFWVMSNWAPQSVGLGRHNYLKTCILTTPSDTQHWILHRTRPYCVTPWPPWLALSAPWPPQPGQATMAPLPVPPSAPPPPWPTVQCTAVKDKTVWSRVMRGKCHRRLKCPNFVHFSRSVSSFLSPTEPCYSLKHSQFFCFFPPVIWLTHFFSFKLYFFFCVFPQ